MKRVLLTTVAALSLLNTAAHATVYTVPMEVSAGHLNIRSGPGTNHALLGAIPAGATVNSNRCVPRDDRIVGSDWCLVSYGGVTGWAASSGLMPGYMPPGASAPVPVPQGTGMQSYPNGEPPYRPGQAVSPDWNGSYAAMPAPRIKVEAHSLQCTPPLDRADRNPVKAIWVSFDYDWTNLKMLGMSVNHERWNGEFIDRFAQYRDAEMTMQQGIYGWKGSWMRNPGRIMAGGVFTDQHGQWFYREKGWTNGMPDFDMTAPCVITEAE